VTLKAPFFAADTCGVFCLFQQQYHNQAWPAINLLLRHWQNS